MVRLEIVSFRDNDLPFSSNIEFQFPPRILSDNRKATWIERDVPSSEAAAAYKVSSPREMAMSFCYIVEDNTMDSTTYWSALRIKNQISKLRGYFSQIKRDDSQRDSMLVYFSYPYYTGRKAWSCRINSVDVKTSDTLISMPDGSVYPLRTDVNVDIRLWTTGARQGEDEDKVVQDVRGMMPEPSISDMWY